MKLQNRQIWMIWLVFSITLAVLLIFRQTVRETFVIPMLYLFWVSRLVFNSLHQMVFWLILVAIVTGLLFGALRHQSRTRALAERTPGKPYEKNRRVAHWAGQIRRFRDGSFHNVRSLTEFRKLILAVWAYQNHLSPQEVEQAVMAGEMELPPALQVFFQEPGRPQISHTDRIERLIGRLRAFFQKNEPQPATEQVSPLYAMIETLENQLEVKRAPHNPPSR